MKKYFLIICVFFTNVIFAQATEDLNSLLSRYQTYQADFQQVVFDEQQQVVQRSQGKLYLLRPGKFRWVTTSPVHQTIVSDGSSLWVYDQDLGQVTRQKLSYETGADPAILLSGKTGFLLKRFRVNTTITADGTVYRLIPNFSNTNLNWLQLTFVNNVLIQVIVANNLGQSSVFNFSNIQVNIALHPLLFRLQVPRGTPVLNQ